MEKPTFVLVHGSWHTGEAWERVLPLLAASGAGAYAPTLSGMEAEPTPQSRDVGLGTHIGDVAGFIRRKDLHHVTLVGHSYSGFVIQGAADVLPDRITQLVYLDAFIPESGQSLFDLLGPESEANMRSGLVDADGVTIDEGAHDPWLLPAADPEFYLGDDAAAADIAWLRARLVPKPVRTFVEKLHTADQNRVRRIPAAFIRCTRFPYMESACDKAVALGWPVLEIDAGHDAMVTAPDALVAALEAIASGTREGPGDLREPREASGTR